MKVILCMAMTVNGYIATENDETSFVSDTEWENFRTMVDKTGNLVIGRRTYEIMKAEKSFERLNHPTIVVVTTEPGQQTDSGAIFVSSPRDALNVLAGKGFSQILVGGGGLLNVSFLREGLFDEIYLDIEPVVFGKGIKLFADIDANATLELMEVMRLSQGTVRLHYRVLK